MPPEGCPLPVMAGLGWKSTLLACCLLHHVCLLNLPGFAIAQEDAVNNVATLSIVQNTSTITSIGAGGRTELALCECEAASGAPNGLSCQREGWFVSSWEREGSWLSGGGLVPLSHAICCRPCLPEELPQLNAAIAADDKAVAIMSIGCHSSRGGGPDTLKCEDGSNSVVSGWAQAVQVSPSINAWYPLGAAACCTPALLLASGDAWELERCDCGEAGDVSCGGTASHRLLSGYAKWRLTRTGEFVPIGPATCCKLCLSDTVHPIDGCYDLNFCSGHGMCTLGSCQCLRGWSGADCSLQGDGRGRGMPQWVVSLIIMAACAALSLVMLAINRLVRYVQMRNAEAEGSEEGEQLREPLLLSIDDEEGSVGSEDTTDADSVTQPLHRRRRRPDVEEGATEEAQPAALPADGGSAPALTAAGTAAAAADAHPDSYVLSPQPRADARSAPAAAAGASAAASNYAGGSMPPGGVHDSRTAAAAARGDPQSAGDTSGDEHGVVVPDGRDERAGRDGAAEPAGQATSAARRPSDEGVEGEAMVEIVEKEGVDLEGGHSRHKREDGCNVPGRECNVCMARPVQVALIPCGHTCMCRRCSRRLARCPVCRKEILRRQRLFI